MKSSMLWIYCALNGKGHKLPSYITLNCKMIQEHNTSPKYKEEGVSDS
jgi:hypothetical protein